VRRILLVIASILAVAATALPQATAATPSAGSVSPKHPKTTWQGGQFVVGAGVWSDLILGMGLEPVCPDTSTDPAHLVCDHFTLDVAIAPSYWRTHHGGVKVSITWPDPGSNKLLVAAFKNGSYIGSGWGGDPATLILPNASGTYDLQVDPILATKPTSYTGVAKVVMLPPTPANPSLGGPAAYRAVRVTSRDPDNPPQNTRVAYHGPQVALVGHPLHKETYEPTIGVDRKGAVFLNAQTSGFLARQPPTVFMSTDRGRTWRSTSTPDSDAFHPSSNDPYLYVDPDYGRVFRLDLAQLFTGSHLSYTDDHGKSWTNTFVTVGGPNDHPTLVSGVVPKGSGLATADPAFGKLVYYCVNQTAATACARSLDGGRVFTRVGSPFSDESTSCPGSSLTDHLTTDREGRVFLGAANCAIPEVANSTDGGVTWSNVVVNTRIHSGGHDVATAEDAAGNVYAGWTDDQNSLPYISFSRDHGFSWSAPVMVAPPGVHETAMLTLSAGSAGRLAVGFLGTTVDNSGDDGRPWAHYVAISQNALSRAPLFVSNSAVMADTHSRIVARGPCCPGMADFLDMKTAPLRGGPVWASVAVTCTDACLRKRNLPSNRDNYGLGVAIEQVAGPALVDERRR
jgi:hypothetical protein